MLDWLKSPIMLLRGSRADDGADYNLSELDLLLSVLFLQILPLLLLDKNDQIISYLIDRAHQKTTLHILNSNTQQDEAMVTRDFNYFRKLSLFNGNKEDMKEAFPQ
jgi:hypothetical protein